MCGIDDWVQEDIWLQASMRLVSDQGALCPTLDRLEQGLDMLNDAITKVGLVPGQDFFYIINCAAHECFDFVSNVNVTMHNTSWT